MEIRVTDIHKYVLDQSLSKDERKEFIEKLLETEIELDDLKITIEDYFRLNWDRHKTKVCLDIIGYYLSKSPELRNKHDKEVMSWTKESKMKNGNSNYINFSNLSHDRQLELGLKDYEDEDNRFDF